MARCGQKSTKNAEWMADRIAWGVKAEKVWGVEGVGIRGGAYSQQSRSWRACFIQAAREARGGGRAGEALPVPTCSFRARCRSPGSASRPMLRGAARRRCPQGAAVSRAVASAASAAGWAQTPPWGGQASWIQLHSPYFQVFLNDERDRNETEAQNLKLHVFIVHSLHQRHRFGGWIL